MSELLPESTRRCLQLFLLIFLGLVIFRASLHQVPHVGQLVESGSGSSSCYPVLLYLSDSCEAHDAGEQHPESPDRLRHLIALARGGWSLEFGDSLQIQEPAIDAREEQLLRVHSQDHVKRMLEVLARSKDDKHDFILDGDTIVSPGTQRSALRAAGLVIAAVDALMKKPLTSNRAFVMVRPPGHHAEPDKAMGFCIFNNIMVGVAHSEVVYNLRRVAILDFDVHHGNGGEAVTRGHRSRLFASSHQVPLFPHTGEIEGRSGEFHEIINAPLPPGTGSAEFRRAWRDLILPAVVSFKPEFVFVSAGFDGHANDPLAQWHLTEGDFHWVTQAILNASGGVPVLSVLEGGYNIDALGRSVHAHIKALVDV